MLVERGQFGLNVNVLSGGEWRTPDVFVRSQKEGDDEGWIKAPPCTEFSLEFFVPPNRAYTAVSGIDDKNIFTSNDLHDRPTEPAWILGLGERENDDYTMLGWSSQTLQSQGKLNAFTFGEWGTSGIITVTYYLEKKFQLFGKRSNDDAFLPQRSAYRPGGGQKLNLPERNVTQPTKGSGSAVLEGRKKEYAPPSVSFRVDERTPGVHLEVHYAFPEYFESLKQGGL